MKPVYNQDIRDAVKSAGVYHKDLAKKIGISKFSFSVWMRTEMLPEKKDLVYKAIASIVQENKKT